MMVSIITKKMEPARGSGGGLCRYVKKDVISGFGQRRISSDTIAHFTTLIIIITIRKMSPPTHHVDRFSVYVKTYVVVST